MLLNFLLLHSDASSQQSSLEQKRRIYTSLFTFSLSHREQNLFLSLDDSPDFPKSCSHAPQFRLVVRSNSLAFRVFAIILNRNEKSSSVAGSKRNISFIWTDGFHSNQNSDTITDCGNAFITATTFHSTTVTIQPTSYYDRLTTDTDITTSI